MPDVNCTVDNCEHWTNGNLCTAQQIVVQNDAQGGFAPNVKLKSLQPTPADSVDDTCCQTFKMK